MPLIYKGYDLDEFRNNLYNIKVVTKDGNEIVSESSLQSFINFLRSKKMDNLATVFKYALSQNNVYVFIAQKLITVEDGKIVTKSDQLPTELKTLTDFGDLANSLLNIRIPIPVLSEILSGLQIILGFLNLLSNEAKNKGTEEKNKMMQIYNSYNSFWLGYKQSRDLTKKTEAYIKAFSAVCMKELERLQPKCNVGTVNCSKEHVQYVVRCKYLVEFSSTLVDLITEFWNEVNWRTFIDNYQTITANLVNLPTPEPIKQPETEITEKSGSGLGGLIAAGVGLFALTKIGKP